MLRTLRCVRENTGARIYLRATKKRRKFKNGSSHWEVLKIERTNVKQRENGFWNRLMFQLIDFIIFVLSSDFALNKFRIVKCFKHRGLWALSIENIVLSIVLRHREVSKHGFHQIDTLAYTNILNLVTKFWWTFCCCCWRVSRLLARY